VPEFKKQEEPMKKFLKIKYNNKKRKEDSISITNTVLNTLLELIKVYLFFTKKPIKNKIKLVENSIIST
jgi:hypothetical protein